MFRTFPQRGDSLLFTVNDALHRGSHRHTNQPVFLSLLLGCRIKQPSLIGTKSLTEHRDQKVLLYLLLVYPKEVHNACKHWDLERTRPEKAITEGSQSLRSDNHNHCRAAQNTLQKTEDSTIQSRRRSITSPRLLSPHSLRLRSIIAAISSLRWTVNAFYCRSVPSELDCSAKGANSRQKETLAEGRGSKRLSGV